VRKVKRLQYPVDGLEAAGIADALQVGFEVERLRVQCVLRSWDRAIHALMIIETQAP
jgi:hypothetical protein